MEHKKISQKHILKTLEKSRKEVFSQLNTPANLVYKTTFPQGVEIFITKITSRVSGGKSTDLELTYNLYDTPYGRSLIASTPNGLCYLGFMSDSSSVIHNESWAVEQMQVHFAGSKLIKSHSPHHVAALALFARKSNASVSDNSVDLSPLKIDLHLYGTPFQVDVWRVLLSIPSGGLITYGDIATIIGRDGASRAVGTAVGSNPLSYIIPCHRVILSTGEIGGYHWGGDMKRAILADTHSVFDKIHSAQK